jgi:hypothetical protein
MTVDGFAQDAVDGFTQHDNVLLRSGCHAERSRSMTGDDYALFHAKGRQKKRHELCSIKQFFLFLKYA